MFVFGCCVFFCTHCSCMENGSLIKEKEFRCCSISWESRHTPIDRFNRRKTNNNYMQYMHATILWQWILGYWCLISNLCYISVRGISISASLQMKSEYVPDAQWPTKWWKTQNIIANGILCVRNSTKSLLESIMHKSENGQTANAKIRVARHTHKTNVAQRIIATQYQNKTKTIKLKRQMNKKKKK